MKSAAISSAVARRGNRSLRRRRLLWLEESTYNALTDAIRWQLGDAETTKLFRGLGRRIKENPNMQNFIESVIRVLDCLRTLC